MAKIRLQPLANLCRRVGTALRAGVDVRRIWQMEAQRSIGSGRNYIQKISERISQGDSLAMAMRDSHGYFPGLVCEMVEVGEHTGKFDQILIQLADHYDHQVAVRRQFLSSVAWPLIQLGASVLVVSFLIYFLGSMGIPVLGYQGMTGAIQFMFTIAFVVSGITLAIIAVMRGWAGPLPLIFAMRIPYLGGCMRDFALARTAGTLSMALDSGIDARRSIRLALRSSQNPYFMAQASRVDEAIVAGQEFNVALRGTRAFPNDFVDDLAAAELAGTDAESMGHLANQYQERARAASKIIAMIASFLTWACVAAFIIAIIISLVTSLYLKPLKDAQDMLNGFM